MIALQFEFLLLSFIQKHQAIARILKTHILPKFVFFIFYFICLVTPSIATNGFNLIRVQKEEQFRYIAEV